MSNRDGPGCELHIEDIKIKHAEIPLTGQYNNKWWKLWYRILKADKKMK